MSNKKNRLLEHTHLNADMPKLKKTNIATKPNQQINAKSFPTRMARKSGMKVRKNIK